MNTQRDFATFALKVTTDFDDEQVVNALERDGLVLFDTIHSTEELLQSCRRLGTIITHRDSDEQGLTRISKQNRPLTGGYQAFTSSHLTLHTDGSSMPEPAMLVVLWCKQPALRGGQSLFVDGKQIYQVLSQAYSHILQELKQPKSAIFAGAQHAFYGSVFEALPTGQVCIRFRYDNLVYYSAPVCTILPIVLELLNQHKFRIALQQYQGYIVQNGRWLHGRTAFEGEREVYRVLIRSHPDLLTSKRLSFGFCPND